MVKVSSFKDLIVWKKSHELTLEVYKITKDFPKDEKFGLVSQMRSASVSVPANIAEGFKRRGSRDKINFYNIAQSSLCELEYYVILIKDLGYFDKTDMILGKIEEVGKMVNGLISSINPKP